MRKEFKKYYHDDAKAQQEPGRGHIRLLTAEGYDKLNELIGKIKRGDQTAENDFMELVQPWAKAQVKRICRIFENETIDQDDLLSEACLNSIKQLRTNSKIADWSHFNPSFSRIVKHRISNNLRHDIVDQRDIPKVAAPAYRTDEDTSDHETLSKSLHAAVSSLSLGQQDIAREYASNSSASLAATTGQKPATIKTRSARIAPKLHRVGRAMPALRDWLDAHGLGDHAFDSVPLDKVDAVNAKKNVIRGFFGFTEMSFSEISEKLKDNKDEPKFINSISFIFGNSMQASNGFSDRLKGHLSAYLRRNGKEELVEAFEQEFDALRELLGHTAKKRGGTPDFKGASR